MRSRKIDIRTYGGRDDLAPLLDFASASFAARFPLNACWHPGDIVWEMKPEFDRAHNLQMWASAERVEAVTMFMAADQLWLEMLPTAEDMLPDIVRRAERAASRGGQRTLSIRAFEGDGKRVAGLESLGYAADAPEGVWFRVDLAEPIAEPLLPEGFRVRDSVGVDPALRAKAHRDAWNDLAEIGLPDARSQFSEDHYRSLTTTPIYDPTLDMLVEADDGTLVVNALCWADERSGVGIFEPVGTHAQYRKLGLTKLALCAALRRIQQRGLKAGRVGTAHFNKPAIGAYLGAGFELFDRTRWWTKPLAPS